MRKQLYNMIKDRLLSILDEQGMPIIKEVNFWNEQLYYIQEEKPFNMPAVFIEFKEINYVHLLKGINEADVQVTLHILIPSTISSWENIIGTDNTIGAFDIIELINKALFNFGTHNDEDVNIGALTLLSSITDHDFDEIFHDQETYVTHIKDSSASPKYAKVSSIKLVETVTA
jgi:hypothetical protein